MGLLDKVKNLFTEEYEVEEKKPIKKEMVQVEIPAPVEDVKVELPQKREKIEQLEEREPVKEDYSKEEISEVKKKEIRKPVFFDDKDFLDLEKTREIKRQPEPKKETHILKKLEEKKKFQPTPIISPVYGILDKNYHKEDITTKTTGSRLSYKSNKRITLDEVRNKAFGTLEDELETTLITTPYISSDSEDNNNDLFADLTEEIPVIKKVDKTVDLDDGIVDPKMTWADLEEMEKGKTKIRRSEKIEIETNDDTISNSELFDLIDSMYDKGDE